MRFLRIYLSFAPGLLPGGRILSKKWKVSLTSRGEDGILKMSSKLSILPPCLRGQIPFPDTESFLSIPKKGGSFLKNRLEELRKARNISQEELAAALEVSRQTSVPWNGAVQPFHPIGLQDRRYFDLTIEDISSTRRMHHETTHP